MWLYQWLLCLPNSTLYTWYVWYRLPVWVPGFTYSCYACTNYHIHGLMCMWVSPWQYDWYRWALTIDTTHLGKDFGGSATGCLVCPFAIAAVVKPLKDLHRKSKHSGKASKGLYSKKAFWPSTFCFDHAYWFRWRRHWWRLHWWRCSSSYLNSSKYEAGK